MLRRLVAGLLISGLGGCSIVGSDRALFTAGDAADGPVLRPGLWAMPTGDCKYDEARPADSWPKCANATAVTPATLSGGEGQSPEGPKQTLAYILAAGDPPVLQVAAPPGEKDGPRFIYAGLRPLAFDAAKQATSVKVWLALCAQPPNMKDGKIPDPPKTLPPGLKKRPGGADCVATAQAPVRAAVRRSEAWIAGGGPDDFSLAAHWVRDGDN